MDIFRRNSVETVVTPVPYIQQEVSLTTRNSFGLVGYVKQIDELDITLQNTIHIDNTGKGNLSKLPKYLDKECKRMNCKKVRQKSQHTEKEQWLDVFEKPIAKRYKDFRGESYELRADLVRRLLDQGLVVIQCQQNQCSMPFPKKITVNFEQE